MTRAYTVARGERRKGEAKMAAERERLEKKRLKAAKKAARRAVEPDARRSPRNARRR